MCFKKVTSVMEEYYETLRRLTALLEEKSRSRTATEKELRVLSEEIADVRYAIRCLEGRDLRW